MSGPKIIHVIDDDPAVRDSLRLLMTTEGLYVRTYPSARAFLDSVGREEDEEGCVVADVRMPELSGFDLLEKMKEKRLRFPVIVITAHADVPLAVQAMKAGAVDLLEKPFDDNVLIASVRNALLRNCARQESSSEAQEIRQRLASLTAREKEVLAGLLKGQPNKIIAHELNISVRTVEVHRANVMSKMRAGSLSELVRMALLAPPTES
jgi:two-component system response regulator FixJ